MSDVPLNASGRAEATGAASILEGASIDAIHTSPVPRSRQTADIISSVVGSPVVPDEGLTDIDYGRWQGLSVEEVTERFGGDAIESWKRDPGSFTFPGGESMGGVRERMEPALLGLVGGYPGGAVAAVTHMAVLKVCFLVTMGLSFDWFWRIVIDNGAVSQFTFTEEAGFVLHWWNRLPAAAGG